jgi:hypothetical protein
MPSDSRNRSLQRSISSKAIQTDQILLSTNQIGQAKWAVTWERATMEATNIIKLNRDGEETMFNSRFKQNSMFS